MSSEERPEESFKEKLPAEDHIPATIGPDAMDANGHLNFRSYSTIFTNSEEKFNFKRGFSQAVLRDVFQIHLYPVHVEIDFVSEMRSVEQELQYDSVTKGVVGDKSIHYEHELVGVDGRVFAKANVVVVAVDSATRQSVSLPDELKAVFSVRSRVPEEAVEPQVDRKWSSEMREERLVGPQNLDSNGNLSFENTQETFLDARWRFTNERGFTDNVLKDVFNIRRHLVHVEIDLIKVVHPSGEEFRFESVTQAAVGNSSITYRQQFVDSDGVVLAKCLAVVVMIDKKTRKPVPVPEEVREALSA